MRIPSGKTDQVIFFVAVDSTDFVTRKTGLTTFTVYRSRNGGTSTVYTTPTVAELDATHMPGVYSLLIDEDTTIASTSDSEEYCVHITQASMAPVTRTIELYRRDVTSGNTALVDANGRVDVIKVAGTTQTARDLGAQLDATISSRMATYTQPTGFLAASFPTSVASPTNITGGTITTVTNLTNLPSIPANWLTAAGINAGALNGKGDWLLSSSYSAPPSAATIAGAVWDVTLSGHLTAGTTGNALNAAGAAGDPWSTALPGAYGAGTAGNIIGNNINATISSRLASASYSAPPSAGTVAAAVWDEVVTGHATASTFGLLVKTDLDATISSRLPTGSYSAAPSAATVASAVWDEILVSHATAGSSGAVLGGNLDTTVSSRLASASYTAPDNADIVAIKAKTDNLPAAPADETLIIAATNSLSTQISALPTAAQNADGLLDRANGIETGYTLRQAMRIMSAVLGGLSSGHPGSPVYKSLDGSATRVAATVSSGNRSAVTLSP
ncbi:MAG TPA: hypothetical protein VIY48_06455 [Candidatus Paceibacterota bacterium]